jgi:hypothetical protein
MDYGQINKKLTWVFNSIFTNTALWYCVCY